MSLFQAGGALRPESKAFEAAIYSGASSRGTSATMARQFLPQVIGSPLLSGKTTQVHRICNLHQRFTRDRHVVQILCKLPKGRHELTEAQLRDILATRLLAKPDGSLADILGSSAIVREADAPHVLAIINSEALATPALRWLLAGFRAAHEQPALTVKLRVQLLIDGSFGVETLTSGPDSDYPLPQSFPREFSEQEQRDFVESRLAKLGLRLTEAVAKSLWQHTAGDKYLTQVVGQHVADAMAGTRMHRTRVAAMSVGDVRRILEEPTYWHELYGPAASAIARLVTLIDNDDFQFRNVLKNLDSGWHTLSAQVKSIAYEGGLVRRITQTDVAPRAPLAGSIFDVAIGRAYDTLAFLRLGFSPSGVERSERARAQAALQDIISAAALSRLVTAHVGYGTVVDSGTIGMTAVALDGGRYSGQWSARASQFPKGTKVWGLMWSADDPQQGSRATHVQLYRVATPACAGDGRL